MMKLAKGLGRLLQLGVLIIGVVFLNGFFEKPPEKATIVANPTIVGKPTWEAPLAPPREEIKVNFVDSSYEIASGKTSGWFKTGQKADIMLSGIDFNNAGGPLLFNHPGNIATDGTRLLLADRNNNRVLIWNKLPTGNDPPDMVLGQKDFISNNPGRGFDSLNWPVGVATDGKHVLVADTYNDRVLIWNNFPAKNAQPADLVLSGGRGPREERGNIAWPWAVWTNGEKVIITSTAAGQVLIWNKFPIRNNQQPDIVLQLKDEFGTPRTIGSDGKHLVIGDHNAFCGPLRGNFFWKAFPSRDNQRYDFFMADATHMDEKFRGGEVFWGPTFTPDGRLLVLGNQLHIWNSFPENEDDLADLSLGSGGRGGYNFGGGQSGDGSGIALAGKKIYLSLSNGNKIVCFSSFPTQSDQMPDFAIGSPDIETNTLEMNFIISNPVPVSDGKSLFVSSDFDRKLYIWRNLPDESGAKPDIVYTLPEGPWDNALFDKVLVLAGKRTVYLWEKLPLGGELPDLIFNGQIGNVEFQELQGVAIDDKYFYLADAVANKVYIWEGIPEPDSNPKFSLATDQPGRLSSDGRYLVVTATLSGPGGSIRFYPLTGLSSGSRPTILGGPGKFNLPQGAVASKGHLFVGDTGFNRVLVWNRIEDALSGKDADVILGASTEATARRPEIGINKLFMPALPAYDGSYLWIGEFKFSERILRFSPH